MLQKGSEITENEEDKKHFIIPDAKILKTHKVTFYAISS